MAVFNLIRRGYIASIDLFFPSGIRKTMNGTDEIRLCFEYRNISGIYEPRIWAKAMEVVRQGDIVIDVGAFIGLYTVSFAKRVGKSGRVYAFEIDRRNLLTLQRHIRINALTNVETIHAAAGDSDGLSVSYKPQGGESYIISSGGTLKPKHKKTQIKSLDETLRNNKKVDMIKIDVEGYEEKVLMGAKGLLGRKEGYPRALFIEMHPYMWHLHNSSAYNILRLLTEAGYKIEDINGEPVNNIKEYSEIIALRS